MFHDSDLAVCFQTQDRPDGDSASFCVMADSRSRPNALQHSKPLQSDGAAFVPISRTQSDAWQSVDSHSATGSRAHRLPSGERRIEDVGNSGIRRCRIADIIN